MSMAAAPSVICDELPAVMSGAVSGSKDWAGGSEASRSKVVSLRMPSSVRRNWSVRVPSSSRMGTGIASLAKCPESVAAAARRWLSSAYSSMSSRRDLPLFGEELGHPELHPQPSVDDVEERLRERARPAPGVDGQGTRLMDSTPHAMARS